MAADTRRLVAIGGGSGLPVTLVAARRAGFAVTAVVTAADDGGSTGRLRRELGVPGVGDARRALGALAPSAAAWLEHRPADGRRAGHPNGNLLLAHLARRHDLAWACRAVGQALGAAGTVLPATCEPVTLQATTCDGHQVVGEAAAGRQPLRRVWFDRPAAVCPDAAAAVAAADVVVLGPGSLFTSVCAALAVEGLADAVAATPARLLLVANLGAA